MNSRGPGEAHQGREELRLGLGVGLVCSAKETEGGRVTVLSRRGPRPSVGPQEDQVGSARARPLPHSGRPRLRAVNLVPSPAGRRHRPLLERPRAWGMGGGQEVLDSSLSSISAGDPSVHIRNPLPTVLGQLGIVVRESDDPTPPTLEDRTRRTLASSA